MPDPTRHQSPRARNARDPSQRPTRKGAPPPLKRPPRPGILEGRLHQPLNRGKGKAGVPMPMDDLLGALA